LVLLFKQEVVERGHSVASVAGRLGVSTKPLYDWMKRYSDTHINRSKEAEEVRSLNAELKRVTEERNILKKAAAYFAAQSR
jgi:transposase